jgi:hypothetical protein
MSTVIDLASVREERKPHWSGPCVCIGCRHEWVGTGTAPYEGNLQCPACELPKGVVKYPFGAAEGDMVLTCSHCTGEALTAYMRDGHHYVRCMGCGSDLTDVFFSGD